MTDGENRDAQRLGSSHYLWRGEGSVLFLGGGWLVFSQILRIFLNCCRLGSSLFLKLKMPSFQICVFLRSFKKQSLYTWPGPAIYFTGDLIKKNSFTYSFQIPCIRIPPVEPGRRFQADPERFKSTNVGRNHRECYCAEKEEFLKSAIEYYTSRKP